MGFSLLAALLVLLSLAVLDFSIWQVGYGSEPLASALVGGAFLAVVACRDALCIALLALALLTKETALWAPFAAALTVLVRPDTDAEPRRHALVAAAMLLPLAMWLGFRVAFFGDIGSTYATVGYGSPAGFLSLAGSKLLHLHRLFINRETLVSEGPWAAVDRALAIGVYSMLAVLLILCARRGLRAAAGALRRVARERQWPIADRPSLAILWTAMGLALHFALALPDPRYAASAVLFAWPAMVGEIAGRRALIVRLALVACFVLSLARTSIFLADNLLPTDRPRATRDFEAIATMNAALREVPAGIREIYVLSTGGLVPVNPDYLRAFLDVRTKIIRIADVRWYCKDDERIVAVDHDLSGGVVTLSATVPDCGRFFFDFAGFAGDLPLGNRLRRKDSIDYELPAVPPTRPQPNRGTSARARRAVEGAYSSPRPGALPHRAWPARWRRRCVRHALRRSLTRVDPDLVGFRWFAFGIGFSRRRGS